MSDDSGDSGYDGVTAEDPDPGQPEDLEDDLPEGDRTGEPGQD